MKILGYGINKRCPQCTSKNVGCLSEFKMDLLEVWCVDCDYVTDVYTAYKANQIESNAIQTR